MNISIDFDHTYTQDPQLWQSFIAQALKHGHHVYCVSARHYWQTTEVYSTIGKQIGIENCFLTDRKAKQAFMLAHGITIDVWIDDTPQSITQDK
jgi:hypothetical protein